MTTAEVLRAAKALIGTPEKWCKYACGFDAEGREIGPQEFNDGEAIHAVRRCSLAALRSVLPPGDYGLPVLDALMSSIEGAVDTWDVVNWNNAPERTHAEVMAAFDKAIATAEASE